MNQRSAMANAVALHRNGRLPEAEAAYRALLEQAGDKAPLWHLLGLVRLQRGDSQEAVSLLNAALEAGRRLPAVYSDLGSALRAAGHPEKAAASYRHALELDGTLAAAQIGLAAAEHAAGQPLRAIDALREALRLRHGDRRARFSLATLLVETGDFHSAISEYRRLAEDAPEDDQILAGLAGALFGAGELAEAETAFRRSLDRRPDDVGRLCGLGRLLLAAERPEEAETVLRRAASLSPEHPSVFFNLGTALLANGTMDAGFLARWFAMPGPVPPIVRRAVLDHLLDSPCCARLADGTERLSETELSTLATAPMLADLLRRTLVDDYRLERILTRARRGCWESSADLDFIAALAWQCFLNEYVYRETAEEARALEDLAVRLVEDLGGSGLPDPSRLALYGCYRPLHTLGQDRALMEYATAGAPAALHSLIRQQVAEPRDERMIATGLARLTPIDDEVSRAVRAQYEGNPYPRWQVTSRLESATMEAMLTGLFPQLRDRALPWPSSPRILVAGCGTGHHSVATAQRFTDCRVTGVDLSLASLAYATRKTREAGLENVDYGQGDILGLGVLTERFDIVESAGVLHHMADPIAGWRVLRELLVPGGFMKVGLYSERGRASIVAARDLIATQELGGDPEGIRRGREMLAALPDDDLARQVLERPDFYAMSTCRDMLYHVQEHRFGLTAITAMIATLDLEFLGFELTTRALARAYRRRFPDDPTMTSLDHWDAFEAEYPGTFAGMYLFWVRDRRAD